MTNQASLLLPADDLAQILGPELAAEFVKHRIAKRAKMTPYAAKLMAAKLRTFPDPVASVNQSILKGWCDVFPVEQNGARQINMPKARGLEGLADDLRQRVASEYERETGPRSGDPEVDRRLSLMGPNGHARPH